MDIHISGMKLCIKLGEHIMERLKYIFFLIIFLLLVCANVVAQNYLTITAQNDIFTEETFENLVGIEDVMWKEDVTDTENLQTICNALAGEKLTKDTKEDKKQIYGGRIYNLIYKDGTKKTFILSSNDREQLTLEYDGIRYVTSSNIDEVVMECFGE